MYASPQVRFAFVVIVCARSCPTRGTHNAARPCDLGRPIQFNCHGRASGQITISPWNRGVDGTLGRRNGKGERGDKRR